MDILILVFDPQSAILGFLLGIFVGLYVPDTVEWLRAVWRRRGALSGGG